MNRQAALLVFLVALAVRLIYLVAVYQFPDSLHNAESPFYERAALGLVETGGFVTLAPDGAGEPSLARGPGYAAWLAGFRWILGETLLAPILAQLLLDALACVLVGMTAAWFGPRLALPAGLLAAVNLNMIAHAAMIDRGSLLLLLLLGGALLALSYLRRPAAIRAAGFAVCGAGAWLTAPVLEPLVPLLALALVVAARRAGTDLRRVAGHAVVLVAVVAVLVGPFYLANQRAHGHLRLGTEPSAFLYERLAPAVLELGAGLPRAEAVALLAARHAERLPAPRRDGEDPFAAAASRGATARSVVAEAGGAALVTAWTAGLTINLLAPSFLALPPVARMDRPRFSTTPGLNPAHKIWLFFTASGGFAILLLAGALLTVLCRLLALIALFRWPRPGPATALFVALAPPLYLLVAQGPVVGLAARLPFEPLLDVLLAAGAVWLIDRWRYGAAVSRKAAPASGSSGGKGAQT